MNILLTAWMLPTNAAKGMAAGKMGAPGELKCHTSGTNANKWRQLNPLLSGYASWHTRQRCRDCFYTGRLSCGRKCLLGQLSPLKIIFFKNSRKECQRRKRFTAEYA